MIDDAAGMIRKNAMIDAVAYARRDASDPIPNPIDAMKHDVTNIPPTIGASLRYSSLSAADGVALRNTLPPNKTSCGPSVITSNAAHANVADSATNAGHATTADSTANATGLAGPLAAGQTLIGYVDSAGHVDPGEIAPETSISFQIPLAAAPAFHIISIGGPSTGACPGTASNPSAAPGNLCLYESTLVGTTGFSLPAGANPVSGPTRFGLPGLLGSSGNGDYIARGAWAVTAP